MINMKKKIKKVWQNKINELLLSYQNETITLTHTETMKTITFTMQEIWMASRPSVQKSKKTYNRKDKHKKVSYK